MSLQDVCLYKKSIPYSEEKEKGRIKLLRLDGVIVHEPLIFYVVGQVIYQLTP